uniref:Uncharacterized protein n=1 Tax=Aegilops tauschii subsp. strangulata TaxID=200361 RepID=A0A453JNJ1_AEGTS
MNFFHGSGDQQHSKSISAVWLGFLNSIISHNLHEELASMFHLLGLELWFMEKSCMISQAPCGSFSFGDGTHGPICAFGNHWKNMRRLGSQVQLS